MKVDNKGKKHKRLIFAGSLFGFVVAVVGVVLGITLSTPQYLEFSISGSENLKVNGEEKSGEVSYKRGETIELETQEMEGFTFQGWYLNGEKIENADEYSYEFILSSETKGDYEAKFIPIEYTLTKSKNILELTINGESSNTANIGDNISFKVKDESQQGKEINRVYYEYSLEKYNVNKSNENYSFVMPAGDIKICVEYRNIEYTLTKNDTSNGSIKFLKDNEEISTACYGEEVEILIMPNTGFKASKVRLNEIEISPQNNRYVYIVQNKDVEIKVEFEKEMFNISSTEISLPTTSFFNEQISFNAPTKKGYSINRIYYKILDKEVEIYKTENSYSFIMPASDIQIFVEYIPSTYLITKIVTMEKDVSDVDEYILDFKGNGDYLSQISFNVKTVQGYKIKVGCFNGENEISLTKGDKYIFTMPADDVTIKIEYIPLTYTITCASTINGYFEIKGNKLGQSKFGSKQEIICHPDDNCMVEEMYYTFDQDEDTKHEIPCIKDKYTFSQPAGDVTIHVIFKKLLTYTTLNEIKYSLDSKTLEATMISRTDKFTSQTLTIPNTVKENNLDYKITKISENIFKDFFILKKIDMSNAEYLTTIDKFAFQNCKEVTEILFPIKGSILNIENYAFAGLEKIKEIDLSKQTSLKSLSEGVFQNMKRVENIFLPSSIEHIQKYSFSDCERLLSLTIPENTISLNKDIFTSKGVGMKHLVEVYNLSQNKEVKENLEIAVKNILNPNKYIQILSSKETSRITKTQTKFSNGEISEGNGDGGEFIWLTTTNDKILIGFYPSQKTQDLKYTLILPEKDFEYSLARNFCNNDNMITKIHIPKSLTRIEKQSFENCNNLTSVEMNGNPIIEDYAFSSTLGKISFYFENSQAYTNFTTLPSSISSIAITILVNKTIIDDECEYNDRFEVIDEMGDYYIMGE